MTTDKEAARVEPMTHLERARATLKMLFPKGSPFAQAEQVEKLAVEFALVADEALEKLKAQKPNTNILLTLGLLSGAGPQKRATYEEAYEVIMSEAIRSLKVSP